jgi:hypothetical protein
MVVGFALVDAVAGGNGAGAGSGRSLVVRGGLCVREVFGVCSVAEEAAVFDVFALRAAEIACANAPGGMPTVRHNMTATSRFGRMANSAIRAPRWLEAIGSNAANG